MPVPSSSPRFASPSDRIDCRDLIRSGSKSFHIASLLLPGVIRDPAYAIYAFCRLADDQVDLDADPQRGLRRLQARLEGVYGGHPENFSADRALADVVRDHGIPKSLFDALLEGFQWDVDGRRYETLEDLYGYGARVAGAVGAIMTLLMGRRDAATLARACDLGVAMQLTNIARDVGEDARDGRLYLPIAWLRDAGISAEGFLDQPRHSPALGEVVARLLAAADVLYQRAGIGVAGLPPGCRPAINAARRLYAGIGREVARNGYDSIRGRAYVPARRKLGLAMSAALEVPLLRVGRQEPALAQTAFLVDAAIRAEPGRLHRPAAPRIVGSPDSPIGRILELFIELERRERIAKSRAHPQMDVGSIS